MIRNITLCITMGIFCLITSGCSDSQSYAVDSKPCLDEGGVPLKSVWDNRIMADCVFPPQRIENNE